MGARTLSADGRGVLEAAKARGFNLMSIGTIMDEVCKPYSAISTL
jgi:hypothetical protein